MQTVGHSDGVSAGNRDHVIFFAKILDPDQACHYEWPELDIKFDTLMAMMKVC